MTSIGLNWRCCAFDSLTLRELDAIYRARQQVFVIEQRCAFIDADGLDPASWHLAAWSTACSTAGNLPLAYARVVQPGEKYAEPSIGRVLTTKPWRGMGIGHELMRRAIGHCAVAYPQSGIRIAAQSRLEKFYAGFGFVNAGDGYFEDGIKHTEMLRPAD